MLFLNQRTKQKEDAIIGLNFTSFFGLACSWLSVADLRGPVQTIIWVTSLRSPG
jgi:ABC-type Mn2+/Zn2+ transport system permease subunit